MSRRGTPQRYQGMEDLPVELIRAVGEFLLPPPLTKDIREAFMQGENSYLPLHSLYLISQASLSALSLVCHTIREVIEPLLYRRVIINFPQCTLMTMEFIMNGYQTMVPDGNILRLLLRTLLSRPDLAHRVREVVIDLANSDYVAKATKDEIIANFERFFPICSKMRILVMNNLYLYHVYPAVLQALPSLKILATRTSPSTTCDQLCSRFPQLNSFEIHCHRSEFCITQPPPTSLPPLKSLYVLVDLSSFQEYPDIFVWVLQRFGNKVPDLDFQFSPLSRQISEYPDPLGFLHSTGLSCGTAIRNLHLKSSYTTANYPHTHDVLRHLPQLEHLHISFCQSLAETYILERVPLSLRYLTISMFGQTPFNRTDWFEMRLGPDSKAPPLDEAGFILSLIRCLSKTFDVGHGSAPRICGVAVLRGTPSESYPFRVADFGPLEEFCLSRVGITFHEKLQASFPKDVEAGRGVIQIICRSTLSFRFYLSS
ncbi:hypothetical protein CVT25_011886 [Psilocybe cyanescens]|uniref:Uncharacterized protein n=1 Tax=Psilocybe cyanescens TaxID=93625 RepID=A0A409WJ12_PSICY|nr:hypothetical protein CVT25_011886 [Psilocybe cyanescens]